MASRAANPRHLRFPSPLMAIGGQNDPHSRTTRNEHREHDRKKPKDHMWSDRRLMVTEEHRRGAGYPNTEHHPKGISETFCGTRHTFVSGHKRPPLQTIDYKYQMAMSIRKRIE
jgi:hypothetical protein